MRAVPDLVGEVFEAVMGRDLAPAGIVDQHVQPAPGLFDGRDQRAGLGFDRDVGLDRHRLAAVRPDPCDDLLGFLLRGAVVDGNLGPLGRETIPRWRGPCRCRRR